MLEVDKRELVGRADARTALLGNAKTCEMEVLRLLQPCQRLSIHTLYSGPKDFDQARHCSWSTDRPVLGTGKLWDHVEIEEEPMHIRRGKSQQVGFGETYWKERNAPMLGYKEIRSHASLSSDSCAS